MGAMLIWRVEMVVIIGSLLLGFFSQSPLGFNETERIFNIGLTNEKLASFRKVFSWIRGAPLPVRDPAPIAKSLWRLWPFRPNGAGLRDVTLCNGGRQDAHSGDREEVPVLW